MEELGRFLHFVEYCNLFFCDESPFRDTISMLINGVIFDEVCAKPSIDLENSNFIISGSDLCNSEDPVGLLTTFWDVLGNSLTSVKDNGVLLTNMRPLSHAIVQTSPTS